MPKVTLSDMSSNTGRARDDPSLAVVLFHSVNIRFTEVEGSIVLYTKEIPIPKINASW